MWPNAGILGVTPHELIIHTLLLGVPASIVGKFYTKGVRAPRPSLCRAPAIGRACD